MKRLGFVKDDANNRDNRRSLTTKNRQTRPPQCGDESVILHGLCSYDVKG